MYGTKFKMPVVYYSAMMAVAYGMTGKEAGLDGQIIKATALEILVGKKLSGKTFLLHVLVRDNSLRVQCKTIRHERPTFSGCC